MKETRLISRLGRSPGGGHGNPLQYSHLENLTDRGAWRATVHRVTKSQTRLKRLSTAQHSTAQHSTAQGYGRVVRKCPDLEQDHGQRSAGIFNQIPQWNAALHHVAVHSVFCGSYMECVMWVLGFLGLGTIKVPCTVWFPPQDRLTGLF